MHPTPATPRQLFHVAGDAPDPTGGSLRGLSAGYDLTTGAIGHPMLLYVYPNGQSLVFEADVYAMPGQPRHVLFHCPMCLLNGTQNTLTIRENNKPFSYDVGQVAPPFPGWSAADMRSAFPHGTGGLLNLETPCACTWEETPDRRRQFFSRCPFKFRIVANRLVNA